MAAVYPLQALSIDGFRGFREFSLSGVGGVNVLVGKNNSGKTSFLEAIAVLSDPAEPNKLMDMVRWRDPGMLDESRLHSLRWCFHQPRSLNDPDELIAADCSFQVTSSFGLEKLQIHLEELMGEPSQAELERAKRMGRRADAEPIDQNWRGSIISYKPTFSGTPEHPHQVSLFNPAFDAMIWDRLPITRPSSPQKNWPRLDSSVIYPYSYQMNALQVQSLARLQTTEGEALAAELLRQFDPEVAGIAISSSRGYRPAVYLKHQRLGLAPLSVFGDAMRRSVLLASTLSTLPPGGVLLIDEAEAGIHVEAQPKFFAWLMNAARQRQVQIFMTTHSLEALDAMLMGLPNSTNETDLVVYQLKRDGQSIRSKRFAGDLLHRLRFDRGLDVR